MTSSTEVKAENPPSPLGDSLDQIARHLKSMARPPFTESDVQEAEISLNNIERLLSLVALGHVRFTDLRRLSVFMRLVRSAEHELDAATRPEREALS